MSIAGHPSLRGLDMSMLLVLAVATCLLHLVTSGWYGYFIDELYFLA
jgi:hypothetical protein